MVRHIKPPDPGIKAEISRHFNNQNWESCSYSAFLYAESLRKNKQYEGALEYYVFHAYIALSGLNSQNYNETQIDPLSKIFIGPKVLDWLQKTALRATNFDECVDKVYQINLPFRYFEKDTFKTILCRATWQDFSMYESVANKPTREFKSTRSSYDDEDESQYDLPYDEWYAKYVQPDIDKIHAKQEALDAEIISELENFTVLTNK